MIGYRKRGVCVSVCVYIQYIVCIHKTYLYTQSILYVYAIYTHNIYILYIYIMGYCSIITKGIKELDSFAETWIELDH